ncbi:MAG: DNA ligase D [Hyphomicrobiaceae bacterium]|nr:DNA ligase D [Hyphomicrobiaceae bacterium]
MAAKKSLSLYRAKRDFARTSEPKGDEAPAAAEQPRFVVQKHAATRLHYDLRLEIGGVLKSWAVTKGPSLDPRDKRLAVEVEDHPLAYGDFEGTIPKGQYGGGTVMLWDRGFWLPEEAGDPAAALARGELKLTLVGAKLKGSWVLVRMRRDRRGGKHTNWLLIKHGDGEAGRAITPQADDRSVASGRTMAQIAAGKGRAPRPFIMASAPRLDPDAVWSSRPREEARSPPTARGQRARAAAGQSPMPDFVPPQLCATLSRPPSGAGWVHEIKLDGYRIQLRVAGHHAALRTRTGLDWTGKFADLAAAAARLPDCILDGEVVALDAAGAPDFAALQVALSEGRSQDLVYIAFDLLFARGEDLRTLPLLERKQRLRTLLADSGLSHAPLVRYLDHLTEPGDAVLAAATRMHLEGIVSKKAASPYRSGRGEAWAKIKSRPGHEVVIGGWNGSARNLRSLLVGVYDGAGLVYVGRVGTGFNGANAPALLAALKASAAASSPFVGASAPRKGADTNWVAPRLVCEIEFAGWTGAGMVRQAAFKALRKDKPAREVTAERPVAPSAATLDMPRPAAAGGGRRRGNPGHGNEVAGVAISNPDKPMWPAALGSPAVTKLALARYFEAVGPWMIAHLQGRPCSIVRAPDGIEGEHWFQRHAGPGLTERIARVAVSGEEKPYLRIDSVEGLIAVAQIGGLELHPWNCAPGKPDVPGRLVLDLDPADDVPFTAVIEAARELRARLTRIGLESFCKTTGGKGLHVVTPVSVRPADRLGWTEAKLFAEALCTGMAADSPDRYLVNMAKTKRQGRIYLDYLRNDRTATAVAPLSPRARPGATVSMPLTWSQVRDGLDPGRFTVHTVPSLLARSRAWAGYDAAVRPLIDAVRALASRR